MNRRQVVSLLVAAGLLLPAVGAAQMLPIPPGRWWERPRVMEELALSTEQRAKLEEITLGHARELVDLKAAVEKAEIDLRAAADREPFEPARVRSAFAALQQARSRMEVQRFEMLLAIREVLTAPQWARLKELTREWVRETARDVGGRERGGPRPLRPRP
jgi:Spy/CpxP family protein refolding chaperone